MNRSLLDWIRCADCGGALSVEPFAFDPLTDREEIWEGELRCDCGTRFPIIQGVPRLLPRPLRDTLVSQYPAFFSRYGQTGNRANGAAARRASLPSVDVGGQVRVMESFGFEWNEFDDYSADNFDRWIAPVEPAFFRGKLVLDAGCGAGRHAIRARGYGAEVVAMDLSPAVDAAYRNARPVGGIHVVQGDIFQPPFARATFDGIYSLGVLHHTPDPPRAFAALVPCLKPGATIAVMLYGSGRPIALGLLASIRAATLRMPLRLVKFLSLTAAVVDTVGPVAAYRALRRVPGVRDVLAKTTPEHVRLYADHTFHTCYTDWLDRLSYPYVHYYSDEDLRAWFAQAGLTSVAIRHLGTYGWTGVAMRNAGHGAPVSAATRGR